MKILVVGASRGIGAHTVRAALAAGHEVTALARHIETLKMDHPELRKVAGDVLDGETLAGAVAGQDVVVCALGLPTRLAIGPPLARRSYVLSRGTQHLIAAMEQHQVGRLICVTAIGAGDSVRLCTPLARLMLRGGLRWLFVEKDQQEALIRASQLDWTLVRPTALTNGRLRGAGIGPDLRSGTLTQVSRADVAAAILRIANDPAYIGKAEVVSYPPRLGDSLRWVLGYFGTG